MQNNKDKLILALDTPDSKTAFKLLPPLEGLIHNVKVGPGLFIQEGPKLIEKLHKKGYRVFLDLKLHDIPNTVRLGVKGAKKLGVWMLSVHLLGGERMLREALGEAEGNPFLVGITVLTSLNGEDLNQMGVGRSPKEQVGLLAQMAKQVGLNGVVASPQETAMLRAKLGPKFILVTPGIRLPESSKDDQERTLSPLDALKAGADYLVIGRPILEAPDPKQSLLSILGSIEETKKS